MPARSVAFVISAALASMVLILVHHIHLLMYVPTIAVIVVLRHYLVVGLTRQNVIVGMIAALAVAGLFFAAQFYGTMTVSPNDFSVYLRSRMADPSREDLPRSPMRLSTSGISRCRRRSGTPGSACPRICWACRCSHC